jgi:hypothetical protein
MPPRQGINNEAYVYGAYVDNAGDISASADTVLRQRGASAWSTSPTSYGTAGVSNQRRHPAQANSDDGGDAEAIGVYNYAYIYGGMYVANPAASAPPPAARATRARPASPACSTTALR